MRGLTVTALTDADEPDLFGKNPSDLQEDVEFGEDSVTGTLKYVSDYSSAFGAGMDSGNYICYHCEVPGHPEATIKVTANIEATLDEDGNVITYVGDKDTLKIKVTASLNGYRSVTREFDLSDLTCNQS